MGRRGRSTSVGKFATIHHDRRVSEIRVLGEQLRSELRAAATDPPDTTPDNRPTFSNRTAPAARAADHIAPTSHFSCAGRRTG